MNGCDCMNQSIAYYRQFLRKTVKWWRRIFLWLLEVSQVNAYILFCLTRAEGSQKVSLKKFKKHLLIQLEERAA